MKILTLSGWGQPDDALAVVAPGAIHFDYGHYDNIEKISEELSLAAKDVDVVIGWSLGGQIAARAVAAGFIRPKKLVLIAAPFRFVRSVSGLCSDRIGMPRDSFEKFRDNYAKNSKRTLDKAWELVAIGDIKAESVKEYMKFFNREKVLQKKWLNFLDELHNFSCENLDFSVFPQTLILHGKKDAVVEFAQAEEFKRVMPQAEIILFDDAGHAPHFHDASAVGRYIERFSGGL